MGIEPETEGSEMKKIVLLTAVGVGYVLGTRAGRERYEQIKRQAEKVWNNDQVQSTVDTVTETAKSTAADVAHKAADTASDVKDSVATKVEEKKADHAAKSDTDSGPDSGPSNATGPVKTNQGDPIADAITEERVEAVERIIPDEVQN